MFCTKYLQHQQQGALSTLNTPLIPNSSVIKRSQCRTNIIKRRNKPPEGNGPMTLNLSYYTTATQQTKRNSVCENPQSTTNDQRKVRAPVNKRTYDNGKPSQ